MIFPIHKVRRVANIFALSTLFFSHAPHCNFLFPPTESPSLVPVYPNCIISLLVISTDFFSSTNHGFSVVLKYVRYALKLSGKSQINVSGQQHPANWKQNTASLRHSPDYHFPAFSWILQPQEELSMIAQRLISLRNKNLLKYVTSFSVSFKAYSCHAPW